MVLGATRANRLAQTLRVCVLSEEERSMWLHGNISIRILEFFDDFIQCTLPIDKEMMPRSFK